MSNRCDDACEACGRPFSTVEKHGLKFDGPIGLYRTSPEAPWQTIRLTQAEGVIARALAECFGDYLHSERLFVRVWGSNSDVLPKILDVMICKVRKKLVGTPYEIRTRHSFGYGLFFRDQPVGNVVQPDLQPPTRENASAY